MERCISARERWDRSTQAPQFEDLADALALSSTPMVRILYKWVSPNVYICIVNKNGWEP